ncbi:hypothetical protein ACF0H5_018233 [Mactra antiquata]
MLKSLWYLTLNSTSTVTMGKCVNCTTYFASVLSLLGLGAQIAGMLTEYWCIGSRDAPLNGNGTDSLPNNVYMGIFKQTVEYDNGTVVVSDSSLNLREEQYLMVSITGVNAILCLILCVKAIHILVGVSSFIIMTLMILAAFYSFEHTYANMQKVQDFYPTLPPLSLSWSFFLVFVGLVVNVLSTSTFLSVLLYKGEREASLSNKGLGPAEVKEPRYETVILDTSTPMYDNLAFKTETSEKLNFQASTNTEEPLNGGHPVEYAVHIDDTELDDSRKQNDNGDLTMNHYDNVDAVDVAIVEPDGINIENNDLDNYDNVLESSRL